jgi:hypothetical protein
VEVFSMPMLQNVMILTGSTKLNGLDAGLEKDASCTRGKNQEQKKVNKYKSFSHLTISLGVKNYQIDGLF